MNDLAFTALAIAIASAHWHVQGGHIVRGLRRACDSLLTTQQEFSQSCSGDRALERLAKIRASNYIAMSVMGTQLALLLILDHVKRYRREPSIADALPVAPLLLVYLQNAGVASGRLELTSRTLTYLSFFFCGFLHVYSLARASGSTSAVEHMMGINLTSTGHMLAGLIFLNARILGCC